MRSVFPILAAVALAGGTLFEAGLPAACAQEARHAPVVSFEVHKILEENVEGPNVERTYFTVGDKRVAIGVPRDCRFSAESGGLTLVPTNGDTEGAIHVVRSPFPVEQDLVENFSKYQDAATGKLPRGAIDIEAQPPVTDPYPYNGWKSLGFAWKYTFYGRPLYRSVSYIDLEVGVQLMVTVECSRTGGEQLEKLAQQFMRSWWVMRSVAAQ